MAANSSAGRVPLVIWAATVDPAEVPMIRSASVASTPALDRPAMRPISHALPAAPAPARTKARLPEAPAGLVASTFWLDLGQLPCPGVPSTAMPSEVIELMCGVEEGVVFMGVAFRGCLSGAPSCDYLSRAIMPCGGAPITDTAFMGLTSSRWITIASTLARRRRVVQPASCRLPCRCRTRRRPLHPHL